MRSISDGWLSDGKRRGYGYRFVMEDDGKPPNSETSDIMQLIYQESTPGTDLRDQVEFTGRETRLKCFSQASGESIVTRNQAQGPVESHCNEDRNVVSCGELATSERNLFDCDISKELFSSWARFPSRSKIARNGSAGRSDNVAARDFASIDTPKDSQDTNSPPLSRISNDKSDSLPSIKKGTGLFNWVRLHRSDSVDRRRYRAGHRRETSRSDDLKDPDLEIIPGGPTGQLILEQIGDIRSEIKRHNQQLKARGSSERVSEQRTPWSRMLDPAPLGSPLPCRLGFSTFGGSGMDAPTDPCSADVWSRLYEDCIGLFSGDDDVTFDHGTEEGLEKVLIDSEGHRRVSRSMDLRDSTVDFKEKQLLNEAGSKDGLLKLVEQTWGTE
ncbi:gag/polymerase/env polyprotein [Histoplasma ohiense]|nr:gag/polymerase/env polyprotein [Histoplasma ohiense (nom. inval.)]